MNDHHELALWAASCAQRVLDLFEVECPDDLRPRQAIEAARLWQCGGLTMMDARTLAFASHAAATADQQSGCRCRKSGRPCCGDSSCCNARPPRG